MKLMLKYEKEGFYIGFLKKKKLNFCLLLIMVWCIGCVGYYNILYIINNGLIDYVWNLILLRNNCND